MLGKRRRSDAGSGRPMKRAKKAQLSVTAQEKKLFAAKRALVRQSQKWGAKKTANTARRLKTAAASLAALTKKQEAGAEITAKALANVTKKERTASMDVRLMKELDVELVWDKWLYKVANGIELSAVLKPENFRKIVGGERESEAEEDEREEREAHERRTRLLEEKLMEAPAIKEPLRKVKVELGRLKGAIAQLEQATSHVTGIGERGQQAQAEASDSSDASDASDSSSDSSMDCSGDSSSSDSSGRMEDLGSDSAVRQEEDSFESGDEGVQGSAFTISMPSFGEDFSSSENNDIGIPREAAQEEIDLDLSDCSLSDGSSLSESSSSSLSSDGQKDLDGSSEGGSGSHGFDFGQPDFETFPSDGSDAAISRDEAVYVDMDMSNGSSGDGGSGSDAEADGVTSRQIEKTKRKKRKSEGQSNVSKKDKTEKKGKKLKVDRSKDRKKAERRSKAAPPAEIVLGGKAGKTKGVSSMFVTSLSGALPDHQRAGGKQESKPKPSKKAKRNRPGQRARQREWEKKYGTTAKHLHTRKRAPVVQEEVAGDVHPSWAMKQKQAGKLDINQFKGNKMTFDDDGEARSTQKPARRQAKKADGGAKKQDFSRVHPSWAVRQKQEASIGLGGAQGKRVTFD